MLSISEPLIVDKVRRKLRRHGLAATLHAYGMRAVNSAVLFRIMRGMYLQQPEPAFLKCPPGFTATFASRDALRDLALNPDNQLSLRFVERALSRGDQCFAICDGAVPVAYGWYSFKPAPVGLPGLVLRFDPRYVYMYKGFTHPRYRGRRLHAIGMTLALRHYLSRGFHGLVLYVESTNFDSLKSCSRARYRRFGSLFVLKAFDHCLALSSPGCDRLGFRLERYSVGAFAAP
jgi:ribosomal protein S18 acetylase RimI-like enzyme